MKNNSFVNPYIFLIKVEPTKVNPRFISAFVSKMVNRLVIKNASRSILFTITNDILREASVIRYYFKSIRFQTDGNIDKRKIKLTKRTRYQHNNLNLMKSDLILLVNNLLTSVNEVIEEITNIYIGVFSTYEFIKAISD